MEPKNFLLEQIRETVGFDLPPDWLSYATRCSATQVGKTRIFPCLGSVAYREGRLFASSDAGNLSSSLVRLLGQKIDLEGCLVVCPIEPDQREAEEITRLVKEKRVSVLAFGALHPSPTLRGKTLEALKKHKMHVFDLADDAVVSEADRRFWLWAAHGRSYVHLKISLSREGMVVPNIGQKSHMAGPESKKRIHRLRGIYDGLLVGAATVRMYDSQMTYRGEEGLLQPKKIIISQSGVLAPELSAFKGEAPIITSETDMMVLTRYLAKRNITGILVEGGYCVYKWFIQQNVVDEVSLVWTEAKGSPTGLLLPGRLPYGSLRMVGNDVWECIRWPVCIQERKNPTCL